MLAELKAYHGRVLDGIAELARLVEGGAVNGPEVAKARLNLSKASSARSQYITATIYPALQQGADQQLAADLALLSQDFLARRKVSSEHVTTWTLRAMESDWRGYQAASKRIRQMMLDRIELERRLLYPRLG